MITTISEVRSREILDSRGNPTIEVDVILSDGSLGRASVPSGTSKGAYEVIELRDEDPTRFGGLGVLRAIDNVHKEIAPHIKGCPALDQTSIDNLLKKIDGTPDKSRLGGNALLGVSMAVAHAASISEKAPLYRYLAQGGPITLPVPMFNILNGGKHAENSTDIQEFMVVPVGFDTFRQAVQTGTEVYRALEEVLRDQGYDTRVGDEGGFAPSQIKSNQEALEFIMIAITKAGYTPGHNCFIALDVAANELLTKEGLYALSKENEVLSSSALIERYEKWAANYSILSIEDGLNENDWESWTLLTDRLGKQLQIVGDDLFTTNPRRIKQGIDIGASNAVLVKLNQIGTVTETLEAIQLTQAEGWGTIISHRSGETEDTTIADLAVATSAGQIKSGAPCHSERTAKYNRLLLIEEELQNEAEYAGKWVYDRFIQKDQTNSTI